MGHGEFISFAQNVGFRNLPKLDMMEVWILARLMKLVHHKLSFERRKTKIEEQE